MNDLPTTLWKLERDRKAVSCLVRLLPYGIEVDIAHDGVVVLTRAFDTDQEAMARSAAAMIYKPPATLATHMPPDQMLRLRRILARYRMHEEPLLAMKPFMAISLLVFAEWARWGYMPDLGVDGYLIVKAKELKKPVVKIEGVDMQISLMDSLTEAENLAIFKGTLDALETGLTGEQIKGLVAAWQQGDPKAMLEIARRYNERIPGAAEYEEKFIWSRHPDMVKKIEGYLNDTKQRHFIAVGALHLAGPRGLVEMLRQRGYVVRQK